MSLHHYNTLTRPGEARPLDYPNRVDVSTLPLISRQDEKEVFKLVRFLNEPLSRDSAGVKVGGAGYMGATRRAIAHERQATLYPTNPIEMVSLWAGQQGDRYGLGWTKLYRKI